MPAAEVVLPDKKVHRTVLDDPPQRLVQYLDNKLGLKQPVQPTELSDSLRDVLLNDEARFERLSQDLYKIYEDIYTRDGDQDGKVPLEDYRSAIYERAERYQVNNPGPSDDPDDVFRRRAKKKADKKADKKDRPDNFEGSLPGPDEPTDKGDSVDKPETDKDQEIAIYQLAIGALALFLLISIAR